MVKIIPTSFSDCQNIKCKECKFVTEIPVDKIDSIAYFEYCKHRIEFEKQDLR